MGAQPAPHFHRGTGGLFPKLSPSFPRTARKAASGGCVGRGCGLRRVSQGGLEAALPRWRAHRAWPGFSLVFAPALGPEPRVWRCHNGRRPGGPVSGPAPRDVYGGPVFSSLHTRRPGLCCSCSGLTQCRWSPGAGHLCWLLTPLTREGTEELASEWPPAVRPALHGMLSLNAPYQQHPPAGTGPVWG